MWVRPSLAVAAEEDCTSDSSGASSGESPSMDTRAQRPQLNASEDVIFPMPSLLEYAADLKRLMAIAGDGPTKSFAFRRLKLLESKFNLYTLLNEGRELGLQKV